MLPRRPVSTIAPMGEGRRTLSASEMDTMSAQQRADAVDAGIARDWSDVDPEFRQAVEARARQFAADLPTDG